MGQGAAGAGTRRQRERTKAVHRRPRQLGAADRSRRSAALTKAEGCLQRCRVALEIKGLLRGPHARASPAMCECIKRNLTSGGLGVRWGSNRNSILKPGWRALESPHTLTTGTGTTRVVILPVGKLAKKALRTLSLVSGGPKERAFRRRASEACSQLGQPLGGGTKTCASSHLGPSRTLRVRPQGRRCARSPGVCCSQLHSHAGVAR